jgi:hypothetical protein
VPGLVYGVTINVSPGLRSAQSQQPYYAIPYFLTEGGYIGQSAITVPSGPPGPPGPTSANPFMLFFPQQGTKLGFPPFPNIPPTPQGLLKPIGATSIMVLVGSNTGVPIANQEAQVEILNTGVLYDPRDSQRWAPMPPGAFAVNLYNNSTTDSYNFYVALGIDG